MRSPLPAARHVRRVRGRAMSDVYDWERAEAYEAARAALPEDRDRPTPAELTEDDALIARERRARDFGLDERAGGGVSSWQLGP